MDSGSFAFHLSPSRLLERPDSTPLCRTPPLPTSRLLWCRCRRQLIIADSVAATLFSAAAALLASPPPSHVPPHHHLHILRSSSYAASQPRPPTGNVDGDLALSFLTSGADRTDWAPPRRSTSSATTATSPEESGSQPPRNSSSRTQSPAAASASRRRPAGRRARIEYTVQPLLRPRHLRVARHRLGRAERAGPILRRPLLS
ncbi:hypothetical protein SETIT_5G341200v2 [Setaria italica]|uniref:Uncharacterized protein n=2 Tax=Setaria TaxID=4554 RepID=A0A368RBU0_SETIT|nr:hypothetical protein SETIT_5G341200v2 [Setaria italica]TKW17127.1 hypothetical protein SEVIR_5G345400v2 [Setaria viridis]